MARQIRLYLVALYLLALPVLIGAQQQQQQVPAKSKKAAKEASAVDPLAEARRTTAISLITSLADEARSFRDPTLRARVQARAADALWTMDKERARVLFRRAWEAADAADEENERRAEEEIGRGPGARNAQPSLRAEVLRLAARRERALGEEFLARLDEARKQDGDKSAPPADAPPARRSPRNEPSPAIARRLRLAEQLLEEGDIEQALQFADPALTSVNINSVSFLDALREKNAAAADQRYASLLARADVDPASDANTVSLLSSYVSTPFLYVVFEQNAGSNINRRRRINTPPADLSAQLRAAFFRTAASILLRPLPPPDQDRTTSGRAGTYMVIARLLPLFEQYAPQRAAALRTQLAVLTPDTPERERNPRNNEALTRGIIPEDPTRDRLQETLSRLDRAQSADERDAIYLDAALVAIRQNDPRAREFIDKIENTDLRQQVRAYIDFEGVQKAVQEKDAPETLRLARAGELTAIQRTWGLTEAARLIGKDEPGRAIEILEEATAEARRIDANASDRVRALVAIATQFFAVDLTRVWETLTEAIKAANAGDDFTGEDGRLSSRLQTKNMTLFMNTSAESFDLGGIFATLAKEDLNRAVELAKSFNGESPRAIATLAVARSVLDDKREPRRLSVEQRDGRSRR